MSDKKIMGLKSNDMQGLDEFLNEQHQKFEIPKTPFTIIDKFEDMSVHTVYDNGICRYRILDMEDGTTGTLKYSKNGILIPPGQYGKMYE